MNEKNQKMKTYRQAQSFQGQRQISEAKRPQSPSVSSVLLSLLVRRHRRQPRQLKPQAVHPVARGEQQRRHVAPALAAAQACQQGLGGLALKRLHHLLPVPAKWAAPGGGGGVRCMLGGVKG